jgi:hypothetical protein
MAKGKVKDQILSSKNGHRSVGLQTISNDRNYISPSILAFHKLEH